ncbi:uncharacterized protein [Aegilops tauschii subsp. strangulata]|uniref:uncharacterized protein n=1 Tax=Aegilops tauschii subsp. strangulata TaxID=200361 RepID=UPI001E1CA0F4|nr:proline-rich protein 36-like [Aegilops tauschii subsp. strangulata]
MPDTSGRAGAREKPRTPAICMLWSVRQSRRLLTPRPPTTLSLPLAPVEVPRRPQHATALAPSFPSLSWPCHACPEPPEPANARAISWLHPELAPLPLSLPGALLHPHKHRRQPFALSLPLPPELLPRPPVRRVHGEPRVGYLRPPPSPLSTPLALSPSRAPPGPAHSPPCALQPPPWPEPTRRTPPKFVPTRAPPLHLVVSEHRRRHHAYLPCSISSSPWLKHQDLTSPSPPFAAGDAPLAYDHPSSRGAPRRVRHVLLNPSVGWASPEVAGAAGESAGTTRTCLPCLCSIRAGGRGQPECRAPLVSDPAGGPCLFKWTRTGSKPASRAAKAYSIQGAFDVAPATRAAKPLGRPIAISRPVRRIRLAK